MQPKTTFNQPLYPVTKIISTKNRFPKADPMDGSDLYCELAQSLVSSCLYYRTLCVGFFIKGLFMTKSQITAGMKADTL